MTILNDDDVGDDEIDDDFGTGYNKCCCNTLKWFAIF